MSTKNTTTRRESIAKRLKDWAGVLGRIVNILFYLFIISMFLGSGLFGGVGSSSNEFLYGEGENKIAVVDISGVIVEAGGDDLSSASGGVITVRHLIKTFEEIKKDESVKGLVLRVNSPGGSVTASEEIFQLIKKFKKETQIPVIMSLSDLAASGGYYIALAGDYIISSPTTLTGSIGVIIQTINIKELAEKVGIEGVTIVGGENKDMLNPFEEVKEGDIKILQSIVNEARSQFIDRVVAERSIGSGQLGSLIDGRVVSGSQAYNKGLVDELGGFEKAIETAKTRAGISKAQVVVYGKLGVLESLLGAVSKKFTLTGSLDVLPLQHLIGRPAYLYLP